MSGNLNPKNRDGSALVWIIIPVAAAVMIGAVVWHFRHGSGGDVQYDAEPVMRGDITNMVTATGSLNPVLDVTVGSQVSGIIDKLYADYNSEVKSNEIIAQIDPSTYQAAVEQAQADLANSKANLELQEAEARRDDELYTNKLISGSDYDTQIATRDEAAATVQIKQAALDDATANLNYCQIRSPVDGVVIQRAVDVGQTVASSFNTPTLFQIANDLTKMQIDSAVAEADVGGVVDGQAVDFTVDAYPYRTFKGAVNQVRDWPATNNNVVTYDCVISVTNTDKKLLPGMTANASIIVAERHNVLIVPNSALRFHPFMAMSPTGYPGAAPGGAGPTGGPPTASASAGGAPGAPGGQHAHGPGGPGHMDRMLRTVYILNNTGGKQVLKPVQVHIGITDGIYTEITDGLNDGDNVVVAQITPMGGGQVSNPLSGIPRFR